MAITVKQFEQLNEMGISLWQSRTTEKTDDSQQISYLAQSQKSLTNLFDQTLFNDILRCLNLTIGEIKAQDNHLDAGLFNWYFIDKVFDTEDEEKTTISYIDNKLTTPCIEKIALSAQLKKQLWHTVAYNLL